MNPMGWVGGTSDAPRQPNLAALTLPALDPVHIRGSNSVQAPESFQQQPASARRSGKTEARVREIEGALTARAEQQQQPLPPALRMPTFVASFATEDDERSRGRAMPKPPKARGWVGGEAPARKRVVIELEREHTIVAEDDDGILILDERLEREAREARAGKPRRRRRSHPQPPQRRRSRHENGTAGGPDDCTASDAGSTSGDRPDEPSLHASASARPFLGAAVKLPPKLQARIDELRRDEVASEAFEAHIAAVLATIAPPKPPPRRPKQAEEAVRAPHPTSQLFERHHAILTELTHWL